MPGKRTAAMLAESFKKPSYEDFQAPQTSFRLNGLVHAKLKAICEMYPSQGQNDIVNKLLTAALEDFEFGLRGTLLYNEPLEDGSTIARYEGDEDVAMFKKLTEKHGDQLVKKLREDDAKKRSKK